MLGEFGAGGIGNPTGGLGVVAGAPTAGVGFGATLGNVGACGPGGLGGLGCGEGGWTTTTTLGAGTGFGV